MLRALLSNAPLEQKTPAPQVRPHSLIALGCLLAGPLGCVLGFMLAALLTQIH